MYESYVESAHSFSYAGDSIASDTAQLSVVQQSLQQQGPL